MNKLMLREGLIREGESNFTCPIQNKIQLKKNKNH